MRVVSLVVPCRNECAHIDAFCRDALAQALPDGWALELLIADGSSDDGTHERLVQIAQREPRLRRLDNPQRIVSTALNRAVEAARGEVIVRMDVHTAYAYDYVAQCLAALEQTGASCVGGPWRPLGEGWPADAIARAFASRFGAGGALSRSTGYSGPVDTVYLGAWRRDELLRRGGFDEALVRNQDDELNLRIVRGGGRVWQSAAIRSWYTPRASFAALFRQFFQYGWWKVAVMRKHGQPAAPRQVAPFLFVALLAMLILTAPWLSLARAALVGALGLYFAAALAAASALAPPWREPRTWLGITWAYGCMHAGYGLGFARALIDALVRRRSAPEAATRSTR